MRKFTLLLTVKIASFITALLFLFDSAVFGYDGDYYTYGTINIVAPAWQMMSLVFSDTSYGSLITAAVLVSGFIVIGGAFVSWYKTGKASFFAWLPQILIGVFLWLIVFNGYGNLTIYDQTLNAFKQVPGVPNGLIFVANVMSTIEKNVVDIVTTAGSPLIPYADGGKGLGFNLFQAAYDLEVQGVPMQENLDKSLNQYNKDCLMFELSQPNPSITPDAIMNSSDLFTTIWALAGNPAIPTLYYNDANPNGTPTTCDQAWANIASDLQNSVTSNTLLQSICQSQGFNKSDPNQIARCQTITNEYITALMNNANITTVQNFLIQNKMAQKLDSTIRDIDPIAASSTMATYNTMQSMLGAGQTIPQWMPVARGVFTAIAVSLMPFLCLVIPTALSVRGLKMIIGFFVFLCCWGICDAILHTLLLTLSLNEFAFVQSHNIGLTALMTMPEATTRAVAVYGYILTASILLALFVTTIFVEFGGYALTSMASNITGTIEGAGARGAETSMDPGKSGQYRDSLREGIANTGKADMANMQADIAQRMARGVREVTAGTKSIDAAGGFGSYVDKGSTSDAYTNIKGIEASEKVVKGLGGGDIGRAAGIVSSVEAGRSVGDIEGLKQYMKDNNIQGDIGAFTQDVSQVNTLKNTGSTVAYQQALGDFAKKYDMTEGQATTVLSTAPVGQAIGEYDKFRLTNLLLDNKFGGYGQKGYQNYLEWERQGAVIDAAGAASLANAGYGKFYAGQKLSVNYGNDGNAIVSATGDNILLENDQRARVTTDGSGTKIAQTGGGWSHETILDRNGNEISSKGARTWTKEDPMDLGDGRHSIVGGETRWEGDQIFGREVMMRDNKTGKVSAAGITMDETTGEAVFVSARSGKEFMRIDKDSDLYERLHTSRVGTDIQKIDRESIDNYSTTLADGKVLAGGHYERHGNEVVYSGPMTVDGQSVAGVMKMDRSGQALFTAWEHGSTGKEGNVIHMDTALSGKQLAAFNKALAADGHQFAAQANDHIQATYSADGRQLLDFSIVRGGHKVYSSHDETKVGKTKDTYVDREDIHAGTKVDGAITSVVKDYFGEGAATAVATGMNVTADVSTVVGGARAIRGTPDKEGKAWGERLGDKIKEKWNKSGETQDSLNIIPKTVIDKHEKAAEKAWGPPDTWGF
jgi:hypothetical protein